jgi:hypothetical protein
MAYHVPRCAGCGYQLMKTRVSDGQINDCANPEKAHAAAAALKAAPRAAGVAARRDSAARKPSPPPPCAANAAASSTAGDSAASTTTADNTLPTPFAVSHREPSMPTVSVDTYPSATMPETQNDALRLTIKDTA